MPAGAIAFLFPGQGSQKVGMGAALREQEPELHARYMGLAEQVAGMPIGRYAEEGPIEELTRTDVAQPALFATSLALNELARRAGVRPAFGAGHSLGEWTAAVAAGALELEDGMRLVCERGRLMAAAQDERPGSMAAIAGLSAEEVQRACEEAASEGVVVAANFNAPSQIVVSGDGAAVDRATELAREAGGRAKPLRTGAAFHSPLMEPAQRRLRELLDGVELRDPEIPIAANAPGGLVRDAGELRAALVAQIVSPVRWVDCVQALAAAGCRHLVELGPGRVLSGLVRRIDADLEATSVDSPEKLADIAAYVA